MNILQQPQIITKQGEMFLIKEEDIKKYLHKMPRHNIEIVFWGSDPWSIYVLKALEDNFDVKTVVTASDSAAANYFKGSILIPDKLDDDFLTTNYQLLTSDLFIVASYGKIISENLLNIPKYGCINIHPSLLPKYRGPSPIQSAILAGDKTSGITIIKMDEEVDHGPIMYQEPLELSDCDNFDTLSTKMFLRASEVLPKIIDDFIAGKIQPKTQDESEATFCERLTKEDGYFDIGSPPSPKTLDRMIRAYYPWPGVWTKWNGKIVKFYPEGKIQMEGKKIILIRNFLNGYPDFPLRNLNP